MRHCQLSMRAGRFWEELKESDCSKGRSLTSSSLERMTESWCMINGMKRSLNSSPAILAGQGSASARSELEMRGSLSREEADIKGDARWRQGMEEGWWKDVVEE